MSNFEIAECLRISAVHYDVRSSDPIGGFSSYQLIIVTQLNVMPFLVWSVLFIIFHFLLLTMTCFIQTAIETLQLVGSDRC